MIKTINHSYCLVPGVEYEICTVADDQHVLSSYYYFRGIYNLNKIYLEASNHIQGNVLFNASQAIHDNYHL